MRAVAVVLLLLLLLLLVLASCAPSRRFHCDPSAPDCTPVDAAIVVDTPVISDAPPDAAKRGFGDPCTDSTQCQSDACILVSTGGICTQLCGSCPDGFGCLGVVGVLEPGEVSFVCVPTSNQLCSPCQTDSECTLLGMDKCVTEPTGRRYCARDCSTVACPTGYACTNQVIDSVNYKQCVPASNACDCQTAAQAGATDACTVPNALGTTCAGTRSCGGAAGWGACLPPSQTDDPDATFTDDNCDGIDGDITRGVFVSGAGVDSAACGATFGAACKTISNAIVRAVQLGRPNVYVQAGTYNEVLVAQSGINVWGGYDIRWQRGPYSDPAHQVVVIGKQDTGIGGDGEYLTVRARNLIAPVTIADLVLQGPDAQGVGGSSGLDGRSSYVVHASGAQLALTRVQIVAGRGAPGGTGSTGTDAAVVDAQPAMTGGRGGNGNQGFSGCEDTTAGLGGAAGVNNNACVGPSSRSTVAGAGGKGGPKDNNCPFDFTAKHGTNGTDAFTLPPQVFGVAGLGGTGGNSCGPTTNGHDGITVNGAGGTASAGGYLGGANGLYWYARAGNAGGTGENGTGGGGGGGGGGCDNGTDAAGGGGGGGGAGGCAARGGGVGGGGGGGSFGIVAAGGSAITLDSCTLFRGTGGTGGTGGSGGRGQSGGAGGPGGLHPNSATPGNGGNGLHGGHGGGGGGGVGGRSVGILATPGATITGACTQSQGMAGAGGSGGASAPGAPATERDGNPGAAASAGSLEDARQCASATSC